MLEGVLARDEELAGSTSTELVGPGELLQPWTEDEDDALFPHPVRWTVLEPARLGVLGPTFVASCARWPVVTAALLGRAVRQSSRAATLHAICQLSRVDMRLLALFWHLAERWGRVGADGVVLPLRLQHESLGHLIGAKRPTVTLALQRLSERGLVARREDGTWALPSTPPEELRELQPAYSLTPTLISNFAGSERTAGWRTADGRDTLAAISREEGRRCVWRSRDRSLRWRMRSTTSRWSKWRECGGRINVGLIDDVEPGDWVLIHVGFAMSRIDEAEAMATHRLLKDMGAEYEQELEELKASDV